MSVPDEIDDLIGVLRSSALASELVDEHRTVAAMAEAFQSSERRTNMHSTSRRARIGVLIATGIIGFGGVAAAGPGGVFEDNDDVVEESTTTTEAVDHVDHPRADDRRRNTSPGSDHDGCGAEGGRGGGHGGGANRTDRGPCRRRRGDSVRGRPEHGFPRADCLAGNHGKTVTRSLDGELVVDDIETDIDVRDAAHSSCGKQEAEAEAIDPEEENESVETNESDETTARRLRRRRRSPATATATAMDSRTAQGHGKGNGD